MATTPWRVEKDRVFPSGVVERTWGGQLGLTYNPLNDLFGTLGLRYERMQNVEHRPHVNDSTVNVSFSVAYKLDGAL